LELGEKIRESRTHLGLTQTELADKIGVTLRTITKYEKQGDMPWKHPASLPTSEDLHREALHLVFRIL